MNRVALPSAAVSRWSACFQAGRLDDCEALAHQLVRDCPDAGKAWQLLGMTRFACGDLAAALAHLRRAVGLERRDHSIWDNLGIVLQKSGDHLSARDAFGRALALAPAVAGIWSNAAGNELDAGNLAEAQRLARHALALAPGLAAGWLQLGNALARQQSSADAEAALREALRIQPHYPEALLSLSALLTTQNRLREARAAAEAALRINAGFAPAHVNLGSIHDRLGDPQTARDHYRRARELDPANLASWSGELYCLSHDASQSPCQVFLAHKAFGAQAEAHVGAHMAPHANDRNPERRLRVGVLSGDFRDHPVARFLEPVWRELDPAQVQLFAYDTCPAADPMAQRLRTLTAAWTNVSTLSDAALAACIRADGIDILIDHSGHTAGNRLGVFARKPAPVQVMWFGYPGTSGLRAMDYRLVDSVLAPPGRLDHLFSERLAYLPSMLVFGKPEQLPDLTPAPLVRNGYITFGSFNRMNKLGDEVIALWAEILQRIPDSRLLIGAVTDATVADALRARFATAGIAAGRIACLPRLGMAEYLAAHARIDLLLDAFPWSSSTTAQLGLWMGVPTLTQAGASLVERLGAATMSAAGLDRFVAESATQYVEIASRTAAQPEELQRIRASIRSRLEEDRQRVPAQVARVLERRLRQMWQRWRQDLPPCVLD